MRRPMVWMLAVVLLIVLGAAAPAAARRKEKIAPAAGWLIPAATLTGLGLNLTQAPNAQFTPNTRTECAAFSAAVAAARAITTSFAYQYWSAGTQDIFDEAVFVLPNQKAAKDLFKPYKDVTAAKACFGSQFASAPGSSVTTTVAVQPQTVKVPGANDVASDLINIMFATSRGTFQLQAQTLALRYKTGVVDSFILTPPTAFTAASTAITQAIKKDIAQMG